jgi:hypothetical protein
MIFGVSVCYLLACFIVAYFGRNRTMTFWGYFFASLCLTPLVGVLLVAISKNREEKN